MTREDFAGKVLPMDGMLYRVSYSLLGNPHDQADAVQECMARALQKIHTLRDERYLRTWVTRILLNACYDLLRKRQRELPTEALEVVSPPQGDGEMVEALAALDAKFRVTIVLHHIEGYTTREIAQIMQVPEGTVKFRLSRGRALLKEILMKGGRDHEIAR